MTVVVDDPDFTLHHGDALDVLRELPTCSIQACVTSPPYLDARPEYPSPSKFEFGSIFEELRRVVSGPALVNVGRIWRAGRELRWYEELLHVAEMAGWAHLDTRIWIKPNANPIHGQVFADSHEYVFVLGTAGEHAQLNTDAIRTEYRPGSIARLRRRHIGHVGVKGDVGTNLTSRHDRSRESGKRHEAHAIGARPRSFSVADVGGEKGNKHPAPMPLEVAEWMVMLATLTGETVIDPFIGSGTTALAARKHRRLCVGIEQSSEYALLASVRLSQQSLLSDAV
jgi:DNA modification methylase